MHLDKKKLWSVIAITAFIWAKVQMALLGYLRRWTASDHKGFFVLQKTLYYWSCFFIKKFILLASTVCHVLLLKVISTRLVDIKTDRKTACGSDGMSWIRDTLCKQGLRVCMPKDTQTSRMFCRQMNRTVQGCEISQCSLQLWLETFKG